MIPMSREKELLSLLYRQPIPLYHPPSNLGLFYAAKSGCTFSVKWFFFQIGFLEAANFYHSLPHKYRAQVFLKSQNYRSKLNGLIGSECVFLVRNPLSRVVSSYIHAVRYNYEKEKMSRFLSRVVDSTNSFTFSEFVAYLESINIKTCNIHHRLQIHPSIEEGLVRPNIVKLEDSLNGFRELEKRLGLKSAPLDKIRESLSFRYPEKDLSFEKYCYNIKFTAMSSFPMFQYFYSDELVAKVIKIYEKDFDLLGYEKDLVAAI